MEVISMKMKVGLICLCLSSRRPHTRLQGDWSSDVCSSDLLEFSVDHGFAVVRAVVADEQGARLKRIEADAIWIAESPGFQPHSHRWVRSVGVERIYRSEERRVGKECRSRWSPYH